MGACVRREAKKGLEEQRGEKLTLTRGERMGLETTTRE